MDARSHRRRFLQLTGAGAVTSIAGCSQLNGIQDDGTTENESDSDGDDESDGSEPASDSDAEDEGEGESDVDPDDGITAFVEPDQEDVAALQAEAREEELSEEEVRERQIELFEEASAEFESRVEDTEELTIEASMRERGLFFVDGSDETLVGTLRSESANALLPGSTFVEVREQRGGS